MVVAIVVLVALSPAPSRTQGPLYTDPTDRFGVGVNRAFGSITNYDVASLNIGWYSDWTYSLAPSRPGGIDYAQVIWVEDGSITPGLDQLGPMVDANPGFLWMIGNEPECIWMGNNTPEQYAVAYHDLYWFIKNRDNTAQIANGAVVEGTPMRMAYLTDVWNAYQAAYGTTMPVDVWNMHNQIARENNVADWGAGVPPVGPGTPTSTPGAMYDTSQNDSLDIFIQHVRNMRAWMNSHGQRNKPLIISEYGVLFTEDRGFTVDRVNDFMTNTFR